MSSNNLFYTFMVIMILLCFIYNVPKNRESFSSGVRQSVDSDNHFAPIHIETSTPLMDYLNRVRI